MCVWMAYISCVLHFIQRIPSIALVTNALLHISFFRLYYTLVGLLELLKFTPLIGTLQGRAGPWWVVINILLGLGAAATYARIDRQPGKRKVSYSPGDVSSESTLGASAIGEMQLQIYNTGSKCADGVLQKSRSIALRF